MTLNKLANAEGVMGLRGNEGEGDLLKAFKSSNTEGSLEGSSEGEVNLCTKEMAVM